MVCNGHHCYNLQVRINRILYLWGVQILWHLWTLVYEPKSEHIGAELKRDFPPPNNITRFFYLGIQSQKPNAIYYLGEFFKIQSWPAGIYFVGHLFFYTFFWCIFQTQYYCFFCDFRMFSMISLPWPFWLPRHAAGGGGLLFGGWSRTPRLSKITDSRPVMSRAETPLPKSTKIRISSASEKKYNEKNPQNCIANKNKNVE